MPYMTKNQIAAAREMDLLTYLRQSEPEELVHIGGSTYATRTHDSLKISNGKWCWWSHNIGGTNALDYLTKVEGIPFWTPCSVFSESCPKCSLHRGRSHRLKLNSFFHPNTPTTGVFFRICEAVALMRRSSTTVSNMASFTRTLYIIIAYLWATETTNPPMARCEGRFRIAPLPVKPLAATNGFPLPCLAAPVVKRSACLKRPSTHFLI